MTLPFMGGGGNPQLKPLLKEKNSLTEQQTQLELSFLSQLKTILSPDQAPSLTLTLTLTLTPTLNP